MTAPDVPPGWTLRDGGIERSFRFADFDAAWAFMTRVAALAREADHHPDWRNRHGRVDIRLTSHDAGGLTGRDAALARAIDAHGAGIRDASADRPR